MEKQKTVFVCANCGNEYLAWQGRCEACGQWNTLREVKIKNEKVKSGTPNVPAQVSTLAGINVQKTRIPTKISEVDRVLGGGIVPGSVVLLAGDPGIGKSTLTLRLAQTVPNTLYVSGEESKDQVALRAYRMGIDPKSINFLPDTEIDAILSVLEEKKFALIIVDSIQTMYLSDFPSTPGSLVQVRESALRLQQFAKSSSTAVLMVGHVTKEGTVAGPKTLEHLVDVVVYLEGDRYHGTRILRGVKNRFGATDEIGLFTMSEAGLEPIVNPSDIFLKERLLYVPGSVVTAAIEGSRPLLVEVQALTTVTNFGYPKRSATGFDLNRLNLIAAVLESRAGIKLQNRDIYVNIVGGVNIREPAADLAVALAVASSTKNKAVDSKLAVFGEIGLSGEIRSVRFMEKRETEAKRLGFAPYQGRRTLSEALRDLSL